MREIGAVLLKEALTASIWACFGLGVLAATRSVWSHFLFAETVSLADQLSLRCLGF